MTPQARLARLVPAGVALVLAGCAGSPPVQAQSDMAARRSNVVPPSISMAVGEAIAGPRSSIVLTARTQGGEAMLFTVDWKVAEGEAGGSVKPRGRNASGAYEAEYTAPSTPGTYHVIATIHEFPSATATTAVRVAAP
jgi:hypothetical protein